ncbi:MAG: hypothetical protein ABI895_08175 [Deltaproteobacteria bacterium]
MSQRPLRRGVLASCCALLLGGPSCDTTLGSADSDKATSLEVPAANQAGALDVSPQGNNGASAQRPPATPEIERESSFRAPVVTGKYVWSANPDSGRVAIIDAETYEIRAAEAGLRPTFVAAVTEQPPRALVINTGSDSATLLELADTGEIRTANVALHQGADSWSVAPGGHFAIAWTDSAKATRPDATDGFQDITVLELPDGGTPIATRLTVGYRPSAFAFDAAGRRAFGITEDGISVVELAPRAVQLNRLVSLPSTARTRPDVSVTPDGSRALARLEGSSLLYDVDLGSGETRELDLGGNLTDLDLSEDGSRAVAVVQRSAEANTADAGAPGDADPDGGGADAGASEPAASASSEAVFITMPAGLTDAAARQTLRVPRENFRSVALSSDGAHAVLFTTARPTARVTLVDANLAVRSLDLIAAVRAVFVTADGASAIVLQDPPSGSLKKGAFSVLSLASVRAPKLVASDAPAVAVALLPGNSERALVTVSDPGRRSFGAFLVRTPNLQVDFSSLSSEPLASGTVPGAEKGFIAQLHPEGRITFIDLNEGGAREITGFELSSKVVNE